MLSKKIPISNIVVLMTEENIYGRELVKRFLEFGFKIKAIIVEKGSEYSEMCKDYLKNDFYSPPFLSKIIKGQDLELVYTENHNNKDCHQKLLSLKPDIVLLGGARILKDYIIRTAKIGILNCHPGLLPEYRGMDIVGWAIYNGDDIGVTCHFVDSGIDSGPIFKKKKSKWEKGESLLGIRVRLMRLCVTTTIEVIRELKEGSIKAEPQSGIGKKYSLMPPEKVKEVERILKGENNL